MNVGGRAERGSGGSPKSGIGRPPLCNTGGTAMQQLRAASCHRSSKLAIGIAGSARVCTPGGKSITHMCMHACMVSQRCDLRMHECMHAHGYDTHAK